MYQDLNSVLKDRAKMFREVREFFYKKNVTEVDCPVINRYGQVDENIDPIEVVIGKNEIGYLHTSPEYGMKKLLSQGVLDIFQMGHVFRKEEKGKLHDQEFTMIEWYRINKSFKAFIEETLELIKIFLGNLESEFLSYKDAFKKFASIDYVKTNKETLYTKSKDFGLSCDFNKTDIDFLLDFLWLTLVEPNLGKNKLSVIFDYPKSKSALAKTEIKEDEEVALRFEIYNNSIELANGYNELIDYEEQKKRLHDFNNNRALLGKKKLPIDVNFLEAIKKGIPSCFGIAVGFDRLMMLRHKKTAISSIKPLAMETL